MLREAALGCQLTESGPKGNGGGRGSRRCGSGTWCAFACGKTQQKRMQCKLRAKEMGIRTDLPRHALSRTSPQSPLHSPARIVRWGKLGPITSNLFGEHQNFSWGD